MTSAGKDAHVLLGGFALGLKQKLALLGLLTLAVAAGYSGVAHAQSPVAAYSFDEGSGETAKDSAGDHDGTIEGASWVSSGKYGSALEFDGENDLVSIADAAELDLTESFTLEAWVQPDSLATTQPVLSKGETSGGNSGYLLSAENGSDAAGYVASSGSDAEVAGVSALPNAEWSHLAFVSNGTDLNLYVDGEVVATETAIAAKATNANLEIGRSVFGGSFDGMIDEVRLFDEVRNEGQIQADRDAAVGLDQMPVAAYSFDEGSGETAKDSAGDHDGAIEGASWVSSGKYGAALEFDGENDLVSIADSSDLDFTDAFTIEAWVQPTSNSNWMPVISKNESPQTGYGPGYVLFSYGPSRPRGWLSNAEGTQAVTALEPLETGKWSHLTFSSDGSTLRLYVNGQLVSSTSAISIEASSADVEIGHWDYIDVFFSGLIDEVRLYAEQLSDSQIQADRDSRIEPAPSHEVTTTVLDSGPSAELVESVPVTSSGIETTIYSLEVPSIEAEEVLRIMANLEVTNKLAYEVTDSLRVVLGSNPSDSEGAVVVPWTSVKHKPETYHWTMPVTAAYQANSNLGNRYLKVILKASSPEAQESDELIVQPNFGRLAVTRSTPATGPMSQPTHALQTQVDPLPELVATIPVNSTWQRVMTRKVSDLSYNDILDIVSRIEVQNTSDAVVQLESKITRTSAPSTHGSWASQPIVNQLSDISATARVVHSNHLLVLDPGKPYLNLSVRAVPVSGTPSPLSIAQGGTVVEILNQQSNPGDATAPLREGTLVEERTDPYADVASIPYAPGGAPQPRVVASAPLYGGIWKGEILAARGFVTGDLAGADKAQLLTSIVLADGPNETTGETIGVFSGDIFTDDSPIHSVIKEGVFVAPEADGTKYVNLVARASRAPEYEGEAMTIAAGTVAVTRSKPTAPINENFESEGSELSSLLEFEFNGEITPSNAFAREGSKSMHIDLNNLDDYPGAPAGVRRVEARHADPSAAGGRIGGESWFGYSLYFPEGFNAPDPGPAPHYKGLIDEVRLYDETLSETQIAADRDGEYAGGPTPVAAYKLDEGSGTEAGDAGGEHDGTILGGATWTEGGKYGAALSFDGIDDEVRIPDAAALDFTSAFTLEAWVSPDALTSLVPVISKASSLTGYGLLPAFNQSGTLVPLGFVGGSGNLGIITGAESLPTESWSHLALASDGANLKLYLDGELIETAQAYEASPTSADLVLGGPSLFAAKVGTWNIFTQWKNLGDIGEIGCGAETSLSPAVALGVRHYKAGAHTNPGETETATPTEGEYLEVRFSGGEVNANCDGTVGPTAAYVIAPLEKSQWYDIVQRIEWTPEKGGPEDSTMEMWVNGAEVLGDDTRSVEKPTLYWRGDTDNSTSDTFPQFGIYRGPSSEDPTSDFYIDAIRSGDSFNEVVPGQ